MHKTCTTCKEMKPWYEYVLSKDTYKHQDICMSCELHPVIFVEFYVVKEIVKRENMKNLLPEAWREAYVWLKKYQDEPY